MSELREECDRCLNNQKCIGGAEYGSLYCMMNRRLKMQNEEDSVYAHKFATMQKELDKKEARIKELEESNRIYALNGSNIKLELHIKENYIPVQKVKDKLEELNKEYIKELEKNSTKAFILKCQITIVEEILEEK